MLVGMVRMLLNAPRTLYDRLRKPEHINRFIPPPGIKHQRHLPRLLYLRDEIDRHGGVEAGVARVRINFLVHDRFFHSRSRNAGDVGQGPFQGRLLSATARLLLCQWDKPRAPTKMPFTSEIKRFDAPIDPRRIGDPEKSKSGGA